MIVPPKTETSYFVFKNEEVGVVFFIESKPEHEEFPPEMLEFLTRVFTIEKISESEALTLEAFEVAPIIGPEDLGVYFIPSEEEQKLLPSHFPGMIGPRFKQRNPVRWDRWGS